jgi:hypothetical protein
MKALRCLLTRQRWHQIVHHINCLSVGHPIIPTIPSAKHIDSKLRSLFFDERWLAGTAAQPPLLRLIGVCIRMHR